MVRLMVDEPDKVALSVHDIVGKDVTLLLRVATVDIGKVIGKQGRTARSLRTLLNAIGMTSQLRVTLDIEEKRIAAPTAA
jgi:predicted RNA-binding protein YlqC (UPF0109 family)